MELGLGGKVVIVTGSGRGIGRVVAQSFAREGSVVVIADINEESANRVSDEIESAGGKAMAFGVAVNDARQVRTMVDETIRRFGRVDVLVNNAGVNTKTPTLELTLESWQRTLDVNLTGAFNCCQSVMKPMSDQRSGAIVSMCSINAFTIWGRADAAYVATKAAVAGLTRKIAKDLAPNGARCNAVAPSVVRTEMSRENFEREGLAGVLAKTPIQRVCEPEDVANAIVFLASERATFISGQVIHVNGGAYM